jgi:Zn-dependent M16 (insulinase) family peptidase
MAFACGLEGSEPGNESAFEAMVMEVLTKVADEGVAQERLEAVLHQLELSQREISGDSYPYGLQIILASLSPAIHGGDPVALIDLEPVLKKLRQRIEDPEYFRSLVKRLLLDNPHRVTLTLKPDHAFEQVRERLTRERLQRIQQALGAVERQQLVMQAEALKQRQLHKDDESILPKVGISDVPLDIRFPKPERASCENMVTTYAQGTNGLVYQQIVVELPALDDEMLSLLPVYTSVVTELGVGARDYLAMQNWQSEVTGGIHAFTSVKSRLEDLQSVQGVVVFSGKALARNHRALNELLSDTLDHVRFDELERVRELVAQMRAKREQSVVNNGHGLAMGVASSGMSPVARLSYQTAGIAGIKRLKLLDESLNDPVARQRLMEQLAAVHARVRQSPRQFLAVAEAEVLASMVNAIDTRQGAFKPVQNLEFVLPESRASVHEAWLTATQVNFCAKAYPTVDMGHSDAPALTVLGGFLRNGFLHRTIREQGGAYGGGASQDSTSASFRFFSYRDPRLEETLSDFDHAVSWIVDETHSGEDLEQAILGVVSQIDKPRSPAGEAKSDFQSELFGRSKSLRAEFRQQVLNVSLDDLKRVAGTYLRPELASVGVVTSAGQKPALERLGLTICEL